MTNTGANELNICHLYPDLMNLYGDRGNIIALRRRCEWRGIGVTVEEVSIGDPFDSSKYDLIFIGGGQDYEQEIVMRDFLEQKGAEVKAAIESGKVFLAICGGYQMLGNYYKTADGKELRFLGALDLWTIGGSRRLIGNLAFKCDFLPEHETIVGFENHSGRTYLGPGVQPLGAVSVGSGNNGEDGFEGARYKNTFCTYSHGSLLPKNPALADYLVTLALKSRYGGEFSLAPLDDSLENACRDQVLKQISAKP